MKVPGSFFWLRGVKVAILLCAGSTILSGCKLSDEKPSDFAGGEVLATSKEYVFPKQLKTEIEQQYVKYMKSLGAPYDIQSDKDLLLQVPREFLDLQISFWAKSELTIREPVKFILPRGGGGIDLSDYVKTRKGSFFVDFEAVRTEKPEEPATPLKVYYLSNAKKRKIGNESFGAGCDTYMDVSSFIKSKQGQGIQVNATDERYVSTLAGTYYFVSFQPEKIYLAALTIGDSRYPQLKCAKTNKGES
jgi:hypothetical protein